MTGEASRDSRRAWFAPHIFSVSVVRRCPVCQWTVDQDHTEALSMDAKRNPDHASPPGDLTPDQDAQEAAAVAGFALV